MLEMRLPKPALIAMSWRPSCVFLPLRKSSTSRLGAGTPTSSKLEALGYGYTTFAGQNITSSRKRLLKNCLSGFR